MHFIVGEQAVALGFPRVQHLAAQRQDGLEFLVTAHLGRTTGRVALHQEEFVAGDVVGFAIGELAGQHGHAGALLLLDLLRGSRAGLCLLDDEFGQLLAVLDMLVQPQLQRGAAEGGNEPHRIAAVQAFLDLTLELRVQHLGRQHERSARKHVFGHQLDALGLQRVHLDKALHGLEQAFAQARFMRAAGRRRDEVDVRLPHRRALFRPRHHPRCTFAQGKAFFAGLVGVGKVFALEQRDDRLGAAALRERFHQVAAQALGVLPFERFAGFLQRERDLHARQQHGLAAQQPLQLGLRNVLGIEVLGVRPGAYARAALLLATLGLAGGQRLDDVAAGERERRHIAVTPNRHLQPRRQRVRDRHAHAVQAAGERIRAATALVELAACVQARVDDLDHRHTLFRVDADGNAAGLVLHAHAAVLVQRYGNQLAEAAQRLVGGVVDHFLHDVQGVVGARIHARPLLDRFQALEDLDRRFAVLGGFAHGRRKNWRAQGLP